MDSMAIYGKYCQPGHDAATEGKAQVIVYNMMAVNVRAILRVRPLRGLRVKVASQRIQEAD
jgi:hypothetical protein